VVGAEEVDRVSWRGGARAREGECAAAEK